MREDMGKQGRAEVIEGVEKGRRKVNVAIVV
jgi:hypothetical protein